MDETCPCGADLAGVQPAVPAFQGAAATPMPPRDPDVDTATIESTQQSSGNALAAATNESAAEPSDALQAGASAIRDALVLELVADPRVRFEVRSGQTVGRGRDADVQLAGFQIPDDISRVHVEFERRPTGWFVRHVGHTNFIQVAGRQHRDPSAQLPLSDGAVLMLTATPFVVKFGK
jgi:pSer/pThr/pTyr-binding forkhead associated (FHA) protein